MQKTKFQQLMDSPKGSLEFNPNQSFALHVLWIVRSPTAAAEMLEKGFRECAKASMRDTPTTLTYLFRIADDQSLAQSYRRDVITIGQHPHYQSSFKSLEMGLPRNTVESKLSFGGINLAPLDWPRDDLIQDHPELDFDPIVLECTEVYLDNRSFYEHSCSREWMKSSPEILKASRSLKPVTYCLGNPSQEIWEQTLESYLKAVRTEEPSDSRVINVLSSGLFIRPFDDILAPINEVHCFLEIAIHLTSAQAPAVSNHLTAFQREVQAIYLITLPLPHTSSKFNECLHSEPIQEVRVMVAFALPTIDKPTGGSRSLLQIQLNSSRAKGRLIFAPTEGVENQEGIESAECLVNEFLRVSGVDDFTTMSITQSSSVEGYMIHPRYAQLIPNDTIDYKP
jgi:hypothetical protein